MESKRWEQIYGVLSLRETSDLIAIYQKRSFDEWHPDAFQVIEAILLERLGELPSDEEILESLLENEPSVDDADEANELEQWVEDLVEGGRSAQAILPVEWLIQEIAATTRLIVHPALVEPLNAVQKVDASEEEWNIFLDLDQQLEDEFKNSDTARQLDQALDYYWDEQTDLAWQALEKAQSVVPGIAFAQNKLGTVLFEMGKFDQAAAAFLNAVRLHPDFPTARANFRTAILRWEVDCYDRAAMEPPVEIGDVEADMSEPLDMDQLVMQEDALMTPGWISMDRCALWLTGYPGHRLLPGRSGYDPLDTDFENARLQGRMIRMLFTGKFRTTNPFYLWMMALFGIIFSTPLIIVYHIFVEGMWYLVVPFLLLVSLYPILGIRLLINVVDSQINQQQDTFAVDGNAFF